MVEEKRFDERLQHVDEVIMPAHMSELVGEHGIEVRRSQPVMRLAGSRMTGRRQPTTVGTRTKWIRRHIGLSMPKRCASDCTRATTVASIDRVALFSRSTPAHATMSRTDSNRTPASQTTTVEGSSRSSGTGTTLT